MEEGLWSDEVINQALQYCIEDSLEMAPDESPGIVLRFESDIEHSPRIKLSDLPDSLELHFKGDRIATLHLEAETIDPDGIDGCYPLSLGVDGFENA